MPGRFLMPMAALLTLAACSPHGPVQPAPMPSREAQWSTEVHQQLNAMRREHGLTPLQYHDGLESLCLSHSDWLRAKRGSSIMSGSNVSHSGSQWRSRTSRIQFGMEAWGENVAYTSETPKDVARHLIVMWQTSPPHRKAMLGNWTHAGNALRVDQDGAIFATMNFGRIAPKN